MSLLGFAIDLSAQSPVNRKLYFQADGSMSRNIPAGSSTTSNNLVKESAFYVKKSEPHAGIENDSVLTFPSFHY